MTKPAKKKTTLALPSDLWRQIKHRAIDEDKDAQALVTAVMTAYLKTVKEVRR